MTYMLILNCPLKLVEEMIMNDGYSSLHCVTYTNLLSVEHKLYSTDNVCFPGVTTHCGCIFTAR